MFIEHIFKEVHHRTKMARRLIRATGQSNGIEARCLVLTEHPISQSANAD
jgi:hypothetical protein